MPRAACANCCSAIAAVLPGLPLGMRISTICLSAKRLRDPPAASTLAQSKCAPATGARRALGEALRARYGANGVERLLHLQQRLVAVYSGRDCASPLQVLGELLLGRICMELGAGVSPAT